MIRFRFEWHVLNHVTAYRLMKEVYRHLVTSLLLTSLLLVVGCGPMRTPVPVGTIPSQSSVSNQDEQYGQQVFGILIQETPLSRNDQQINRARRIVERLTDTIGAGNNIWHVYVLEDDSVPNAAATRGNYVFVWSGMFDAVKNDAELAAVLGHEIAHVLAGHVAPTPQEAASEMLSSVSGQVAAEVLAAQGGGWGIAAGIAGTLVDQTFRALIVNPESQRHELEADQIGVFIMADAGYDPSNAVNFWTRAKADPNFSAGDSLVFFSTHPSSTDRLNKLQDLMPLARERYRRANKG